MQLRREQTSNRYSQYRPYTPVLLGEFAVYKETRNDASETVGHLVKRCLCGRGTTTPIVRSPLVARSRLQVPLLVIERHPAYAWSLVQPKIGSGASRQAVSSGSLTAAGDRSSKACARRTRATHGYQRSARIRLASATTSNRAAQLARA